MKRIFEIITLSIAWFAIIAQLVLMIENRQTDIPETITRFLSFFTILTNILVALLLSTYAFRLKKFPFNLFLAQGALTAITAFIFIVGLVYQVALRKTWNPTGLQYIVDELLHSVIPLFMLGYWFFNVKKEDLHLKLVFKWLIYPLIYIIFIMVRGNLYGYYPYPFLNVQQIGYQEALLNIAVVFFVAISTAIALAYIGNYKTKKQTL